MRAMQTVLVVDDEADIRDALKALIEGAIPDTRVRAASSGTAGLHDLATGDVDLIVSDYRMPGMDGIEFLREARAKAPGVPRLLITAYPDLSVALRAINDVGIESMLIKPFEAEQALAHVRAALFARRFERAVTAELASRANPKA